MTFPAKFPAWLLAGLALSICPPSQGSIVGAEYFTGPDPGEGNATPLTTTALSSISSLFDEASLSLSALGTGVHSIQLRVRDGAGQWSNTLIKRIRLFDPDQVTGTADAVAAAGDIQSGGPTVTTIAAAEYFTGPDPGKGNATPLTTTALSSISSLFDEASLSLSALGTGVHSIQLRVRDGAGQWSNTLIKRIRLFDPDQVTGTADAVAAAGDIQSGGPTVTTIAAAEYFTGPDPGEGNATPLTTTALSSISSLFDEASLSLSALGTGTHSIQLRVQDGAGQWSNTLIKRVEIYGGQTFGLWQDGVFTAKELLEPALSGPGSDYDEDGLSNFMEYALNTNPRVFEMAAEVPTVAEVNGKLAITFKRWIKAPDVTYVVEMSSDLEKWTEVTTVENVLDHGDGTQTVTISDDAPLSGLSRRFVRIGISQP